MQISNIFSLQHTPSYVPELKQWPSSPCEKLFHLLSWLLLEAMCGPPPDMAKCVDTLLDEEQNLLRVAMGPYNVLESSRDWSILCKFHHQFK